LSDEGAGTAVLWSLDSVTLEALLAALVDVKFLRCTRQKAYVRADAD
jgi:hypothetical protein